jgi:nucleoside 2-deoxyribosyltransferase
MKVYIAGNPKTHKRRLEELFSAIQEAGYEITRDWLHADELGKPRQLIAELDLAAVHEADILILLDAEQGWGMYVEMGAALAWDKPVFVLDPIYNQIFFSLPQVTLFDGRHQLLAHLNWWERDRKEGRREARMRDPGEDHDDS